MGLTYFGHPVACRAALKNIEIMQSENLLQNTQTSGQYLQETARSLLNLPHVGDVRGQGLMMAIDLLADKKTKMPLPTAARAGESVFKKCMERGVIVRPVGDRIILSPPLIIDQAQCDTIVNAISESIVEFSKEYS